jgi:hypothetical protein
MRYSYREEFALLDSYYLDIHQNKYKYSFAYFHPLIVILLTKNNETFLQIKQINGAYNNLISTAIIYNKILLVTFLDTIPEFKLLLFETCLKYQNRKMIELLNIKSDIKQKLLIHYFYKIDSNEDEDKAVFIFSMLTEENKIYVWNNYKLKNLTLRYKK